MTLYLGIGFKLIDMKAKNHFSIGQAAKNASVNIQTLRYYERIGLLKPITRQTSGYRVYDLECIQRITFIKRAQDLGFSLDEIRDLLALRVSSVRSREKVRTKTREKIKNIQEKIVYLRKLESTLKELLAECEHGKESSPCPILEKMEGHI